MKTYYSIVSIVTKPSFDEKIHIGLICITPDRRYLHFSKEKFKVISKLLPKQTGKLALSALEGIVQTKDATVVSESYLNYLSNYNNGLIQFSAPVEIDLAIDDNVFQILFKKYIFGKEKFE